MATYTIDGKTLTNIADAIRAKSGETEALTPSQMAEKISGIGGGDNYYDVFWDAYQDNGVRNDYRSAFGRGWTANNFKPKYNIVPSSTLATSLFNACQCEGDLVEICENQGIEIDFSNVTYFEYLFYSTQFTRIGIVDASKAERFSNVFNYSSKLKTIDKIIVNENVPLNNSFGGDRALEEIRFEGVIGKNVTLNECAKLSKASITNIINTASPTISFTVTLSKAAVNKAFETSTNANDGSNSDEWKNLIATKTNVTISLS